MTFILICSLILALAAGAWIKEEINLWALKKVCKEYKNQKS